jgi:hypothetical protein
MALYIFRLDNSLFISSINPDTNNGLQQLEDNSFEVKFDKRFSKENYPNIVRNVLGDGLNSNSQIILCD